MKEEVTILIAKNNNPLVGNDVAPPLELDKEYELKGVCECKCGCQHFDVGLVSMYNYITCHKCKEELPNGDKIHWCHPIRFETKS